MLFLSLSLGIALIGFDWRNDLHPEAGLRILWLERYEDTRSASSDSSGLEISGQVGVFPQITNNVKSGIELSTADTNLNSLPERVRLTRGMSTKSIGLSQAFFSLNLEKPSFEWEAHLGKFESPLLYSPILWDAHIKPEGLLQSLRLNLSPTFYFVPYSGQFSADQVSPSTTSGTPLRRSWLFEQGFLAAMHSSDSTSWEVNFATNSYFFYDLSEQLAEVSAQRGNNFVGSLGNHPRFRFHYAPIEWVLQLAARPLGIRTHFLGAFAVNLRTPDKQRSFFLETSVGNIWKKGNFVGALSYYYNEPDTTVSYFTDSFYGFSNRKGGMVRLSYFFLDNLQLGTSFAFLQALAQTNYQADRKEIIAYLEVKFF